MKIIFKDNGKVTIRLLALSGWSNMIFLVILKHDGSMPMYMS